jgi:CRISPR-associated protein Cmr4
MYHKAYGIIETKAPLHVGATAGEETGNLNLIFRDLQTKTGIIPGSSIRGRFRADMREESDRDCANDCYGHEAEKGKPESTTEGTVKFEYASLVWLPVFCPGQPVVWVTCPRWLRRYQQITQGDNKKEIPKPYRVKLEKHRNVLFFNLGYLTGLEEDNSLTEWVPKGCLTSPVNNLVVVSDNDIVAIHEMALYRQSRTKLEDNAKKVKFFFGVEALPEGSILVFPAAVKSSKLAKNTSTDMQVWTENLELSNWAESKSDSTVSFHKELYFGGLESIGFGRCHVTLHSNHFTANN